MNIFALGDLHLPGGQNKPMDVFSPEWENHRQTIDAAWRARVCDDDVVLVPGDISWAMKMADAAEDLQWIGSLPGRIVLIRGNHDYWWQSIGRLRDALPEGVWALQNDSVDFGDDWAICGTRGWELPGSDGFDARDEKLYARELVRLQLSLDHARQQGRRPAIVMCHYPPNARASIHTEMTDLLARYEVTLCVYGHLHGTAGFAKAFVGTVDGVTYRLASADYVGFEPLHVATVTDGIVVPVPL